MLRGYREAQQRLEAGVEVTGVASADQEEMASVEEVKLYAIKRDMWKENKDAISALEKRRF